MTDRSNPAGVPRCRSAEPSTARRYLEQVHSLRVKLTASAHDQAGNAGTTVKTLKLRAK